MKESKPLAELLDSVRDIEGFPIGKDEDILALSNPPNYTACPNPYITDFIEEYSKPYNEATDDYHRDPFVGNVSEGKNDPIYMAHTYHTKVPYKAITEFISHFTNPGDIILDGFCGSGMTGVAAQATNRNCILSDLSPIAGFISYNNNWRDSNRINLFNRIRKMINNVAAEFNWIYETDHIDSNGTISKTKGYINYALWSDNFICPYCGNEYNYWKTAVDKDFKLKDKYKCPSCEAEIFKDISKKCFISGFDQNIDKERKILKQEPVLISYIYNGKKYNKAPSPSDLEKINKVMNYKISNWFPINQVPVGDKTKDAIDNYNCTNVNHYYFKRSMIILSRLYSVFSNSDISHYPIFSLTSFIVKTGSKLHNVGFKNGKINLAGAMPNAIYFPSIQAERNIFILLAGKLKDLEKAANELEKFPIDNHIITQVGSSTNLKNIQSNSIDYIFIDPPFGANLMYSELNFLWESWIKVFTNNKKEAIINRTQSKKIHEYTSLMKESLTEFYRLLKPNRWITVVFHNSKSAVWNSIQDAILKAGFIIANVAILDKKQGTYNQMVSTGAVEKDLVISAYKPKGSFRKKFLESAGEGMEEEFIRMHLSHLPAEPSIERTEQMLYSKLLAFYVQRSYTVKYDATSFYAMLRQQFAEEDGYWFTLEQLKPFQEYKQKMKLEGIKDIAIGQHALFVADEKSALIWLNTFLSEPKDFQTIHPAFTKVATIGNDKMPELKDILHENFIYEGDQYRRPRSEDEKLSINEKREKSLLREFDELLIEAKASKKKIKECRKQAVLYGFEYCYKRERFKDILELARKLDRKILENDSELNEFVEVAEIKVEGF